MSDLEGTSDQNTPLLKSAEGEVVRGALDPNAQALLYLLRLYSLAQRRAAVDFQSFVGFVRANAARFYQKYPQLHEFSEHTEGKAATYLKVLADRGLCSLDKSGDDISIVNFPRYYTELIQKAYRDLEAHPEWPFPSEEQLGVEIPPALITEVNIKTDFVSFLGELGPEQTTLLRLEFPELINSLVVTKDLLENKLLELTVLKIRQFLSLRDNEGYVTHRLTTVLRGHEHALRDMINAVMATPGKAIGTLLEPSDFSFRFWAHFANLILQEYRERADRLAQEHSYCQAAYLVGFYNVHYRGRQKQATAKESLVKRFESQFRKHPYAYTMKDLYTLRDEKGMPLIRKNTKDVFTEFLKNKLKRDAIKGLPELVSVKTLDNKEYYVRRELVVPLFVKLLHEKSRALRDYYIEEWIQLLKQNRRVPAMTGEPEFERDLELTVKNRYPFLYALLNYSLLFLAKETTNLDYDMAKTMDRVIDTKRGALYPFPRVLQLERKDLFDSAKLRVPLFQRIALLKNLYFFFQRLFRGFRQLEQPSRSQGDRGDLRVDGGTASHVASRGRSERLAQGATSDVGSPEGGGGGGTSTTLRPASASQLAVYKKAVQQLKLELVGQDKTIPDSLRELIERWNPLYDAQARGELVEDVNAMIRDYFRNLKRTFRVSPPSAVRIRDLAAKLAENKSFARIKRKDFFVRYIEIYMLKLMGDR